MSEYPKMLHHACFGGITRTVRSHEEERDALASANWAEVPLEGRTVGVLTSVESSLGRVETKLDAISERLSRPWWRKLISFVKGL